VRPFIPLLTIPSKRRRKRLEKANVEASKHVFGQIRSDVGYIKRFFLTPNGESDHRTLQRGAPA
jgi:hypothetical protein